MKPMTSDVHQVAFLAAKLLPPIILPKNWQKMDTFAFSTAISDLTQDRGLVIRSENGVDAVETNWELLCREATKRARTLLVYAEGEEAVASALSKRVSSNFLDILEGEAQSCESKKEPWRMKFRTKYPQLDSITLIAALKEICPRVTEANLKKYFEFYLEDCAERINAENAAKGNDAVPLVINMAKQMARKIDADSFANFAPIFKEIFDLNKEAWYKRISRKYGKAGGRQSGKSRGHARVTKKIKK